MSVYIHLPILIVVVSLVYSGTRYDNWNKIVREAMHWAFRMSSFLIGIAVVLTILSTFL